MDDSHGSARVLCSLAVAATALNASLSLIFFPLIPLLGWLNFGHAGGTTPWIPDWVLLTLLPAAYYLYWHFWYAFSLPALAASIALLRIAHTRLATALIVANGASVVAYAVVRIVLAVVGIRPDSV
jgi:hypothetical protein